MKKLNLAVLSLLMAVPLAYAEPAGQLPRSNQTVTASQEDQASEAVIMQRIQAIYTDARRNYPSNPSAPYKQAVDLDRLYCSAGWNKTVQQVLDKDARDNEEYGFFYDAPDYWPMGQDWGDLTPQNIQVSLKDKTHAVVVFEMDKTPDSVKRVQLDMVYEEGNWCIDNFIDRNAGLDWKQSMREYLK